MAISGIKRDAIGCGVAATVVVTVTGNRTVDDTAKSVSASRIRSTDTASHIIHQSRPSTSDRSVTDPDRRSGGFTLIELLVVLAILTLLATFAGPQVMGYFGRAKTEAARSQIAAISTAVELYALDNGGYPPSQLGLKALIDQPQGLATWRGPYLKRAAGLIDPWGRQYQYRHPGRTAVVEIFTLGRDNASGGTGEDQDIVSW